MLLNTNSLVIAQNSQSNEDLELKYSSYLGGEGSERNANFILDDDKNIYIAGYSYFRQTGSDFPVTDNAYNKTRSSDGTALYVAKISPDGMNLIFSTWIGGVGTISETIPFSPRIILDEDNNIVVVGHIEESNKFDFPITENALNSSHNGNQDIFIIKLSNDGKTLLYSTVFGGSSYDLVWDIALDNSGILFISGSTTSSDFPITTDAYDKTLNKFDVFFTKLSNLGTGFEVKYSTFLGGSGEEGPSQIEFDSSNNIILTGFTRSNDFPITSDAINTAYKNGTDTYPFCEISPWRKGCIQDIFVSKFSPDGKTLLYSTYIGGGSDDKSHDMKLDSSNNIVITGVTNSIDFFVTESSTKYSSNTDYDAFLLKLSANGSTYLFSTYIGGSSDDEAWSLALDPSNNIYITGYTGSNNFPTTQDLVDNFLGENGFISIYSAENELLSSVTIGGSSVEFLNQIYIDNEGTIIVIGDTLSDDFPTTSDCYSCDLGGRRDLILFKLNWVSKDPVASSFPLEIFLLTLLSIPILSRIKRRRV